MALSEEIRNIIYNYCYNHLPKDSWYESEFEFIEDNLLKQRLIQEFKNIRFAYKLYEGIEASEENMIFEIRSQIFAYASIYEAILHYVLYNYYDKTIEFHDLQYHTVPTRIDIPPHKLAVLNKELIHNGESILPYHLQERKKEDAQIRFDAKCDTAEKLGLIHQIELKDGTNANLKLDLIKIYGFRNGIHLIAEQRKGITYELELSRLAYRRMRPFIDQIKEKLKIDGKGIYGKG